MVDEDTCIILVAGSKKIISKLDGKWVVQNKGFTYPANFVVVSEACHVFDKSITTYGKVTLYQ